MDFLRRNLLRIALAAANLVLALLSLRLLQGIESAPLPMTRALILEDPLATATPSPTILFSPTPSLTSTRTPTLTPTPSPSNTPLGGGSGQIAFLSQGQIQLIDVYGTDAQSINAKKASSGMYQMLTWSADGTKLNYITPDYSTGEIHLCVVNFIDVRNECYPTDGQWASFGPDALLAAVYYGGPYLDDPIRIQELNGDDSITLTITGYEPAWSPDGKLLAVGGPNLSIVSAQGEIVGHIQLPGTKRYLGWSHDGDSLTYFTQGNPDIYVVDTDGSSFHRITVTGLDIYPLWSPAENYLAFQHAYVHGMREVLTDIYIVDMDTGRHHQLTNRMAVPRKEYDWSPDGTMLVFTSCLEETCSLFLVMRDGSGLTRLTPRGVDARDPVWRP